MDSMLDLFMGDPIYDEQKNVIRRDFGVKNIVALMVVGFIGYSLMCKMKPKSGKRKMKGGYNKIFFWPVVAVKALKYPLLWTYYALVLVVLCFVWILGSGGKKLDVRLLLNAVLSDWWLWVVPYVLAFFAAADEEEDD